LSGGLQRNSKASAFAVTQQRDEKKQLVGKGEAPDLRASEKSKRDRRKKEATLTTAGGSPAVRPVFPSGRSRGRRLAEASEKAAERVNDDLDTVDVGMRRHIAPPPRPQEPSSGAKLPLHLVALEHNPSCLLVIF
jgi:hypothetical protein